MVTLQTEHKERIHARSHTLPEKKEGHTFKCRAAALIYWVKMGRRRRVAEVRQGIFFFFLFICMNGAAKPHDG